MREVYAKMTIEVKDKNDFKILFTINRIIQQKVSGSVMKVNYKNKQYQVYGGFRNNYFICI